MQDNMMTRTATTIAATIFAAFTTLAAEAAAPQARNLTPAFIESGVTINRLQVYEVGGVVVIRGRARTEAQRESAAATAQKLGYTRVANLVQVVEPPDDAAIERLAERELTVHRGLDGCTFSVESDGGVVHVAGSVRHELQKDMAMAVLRSIDGVQAVQSSLDLQ
jgi:osmotically-inducible protein OsmY